MAMIKLVARLALADLRADRWMSVCGMLTVGCIVGPLLILGGLQAGAVNQLLAGLRADAETRELRLDGHRLFDSAWFAAMRARPDVAFVAPHMFEFTEQVDVLRKARLAQLFDASIIVSGAGDPVLGGQSGLVRQHDVVLSKRLADSLGAAPGDDILIRVQREDIAAPNHMVQESVHVAGVAAAWREINPVVFGSDTLAASLEGAQILPDGHTAVGVRAFHGFRLYARDIDDVAVLQQMLAAQGINVESRLHDIDKVRRLEKTLRSMFAALVGCAALFCSMSLVLTMWANVARKRRPLSILRLLGVPSGRLCVFPFVQAATIAMSGCAFATGIALCLQQVIDWLFADAGGLELAVRCEIGWAQIATALAACLVLGLLAGAAVTRAVAGIEPVEGMQEA